MPDQPDPSSPSLQALACVNGTTYPVDAPNDTGFELCDGGMVHRVAQRACHSQLPRDVVVMNPYVPQCEQAAAEGKSTLEDCLAALSSAFGVAVMSECERDSDCVKQPHGYCGWGQYAAFCTYGCTVDAECAPGQLCVCGSPVGHCEFAGCTTDADCVEPLLCSRTLTECGGARFVCQTPADQCRGSDDCADDALCGSLSPDQPRACTADLFKGCPVPGRPFLVAGRPRVATRVRDALWCGADVDETERAVPVRDSRMPDEVRALLADAWTAMGLAEHASVAAFARFSMQLLGVGAPASLVAASHAAMADEAKHARRCFEVARRFAGAPLGPGRLSSQQSLDDGTLEAIVDSVILEGCVGETVAALHAFEAAQLTRDPAIRAVLLEIAEDETRHAALAWRFLHWVLGAGRTVLLSETRHVESLSQRVARRFEQAIEQTSEALPESPHAERLAAYGVLGAVDVNRVQRAAKDEVVRPLFAALLRKFEPSVPGVHPHRDRTASAEVATAGV